MKISLLSYSYEPPFPVTISIGDKAYEYRLRSQHDVGITVGYMDKWPGKGLNYAKTHAQKVEKL